MNKTRVIIIGIILLAGAFGAIFFIKNHYAVESVNWDEAVNKNYLLSQQSYTDNSATTSPLSRLPTTILLKAPFTPQAPTGNWDTIHNEDCEEASALMAFTYFNGPGVAKLDPGYVESQLTKLTDWEQTNLGYNLDINSEETARMIEAVYHLHTKILYQFTEYDMKKELAQTHLILFPGNGQKFENPNYKQPGPIYHMLLVRGYTPTQIITNDPGTKKGLDYSYLFKTLYAANGDFDHTTGKVDTNKKNIIVVWE